MRLNDTVAFDSAGGASAAHTTATAVTISANLRAFGLLDDMDLLPRWLRVPRQGDHARQAPALQSAP